MKFLFRIVHLFNLRCRLERYPIQVKHKLDWGRRFIPLLPKAVVLLAGMVLSHHRVLSSTTIGLLFSMWNAMFWARCQDVVCCLFSGAIHLQSGKRARPYFCIFFLALASKKFLVFSINRTTYSRFSASKPACFRGSNGLMIDLTRALINFLKIL